MTTSQGAGTPAKQPTGAAEAAGGELSPQATANAGTPETAALTGRVAAPPDDLRQLEAEIERTREQLGETVQELVARADMKSLARAKAAELRGRVKDTTSQARKAATAGAVSVRGQVTNKSAAALQRATTAGATQKDQLRNRAVAVSTPAWQATPEQVRRAVTNGASGAKERWVPLTLAAVALTLGGLGLRRWRRLPAPGRRDEPGLSPAPISRTPAKQPWLVPLGRVGSPWVSHPSLLTRPFRMMRLPVGPSGPPGWFALLRARPCLSACRIVRCWARSLRPPWRTQSSRARSWHLNSHPARSASECLATAGRSGADAAEGPGSGCGTSRAFLKPRQDHCIDQR